ncbi:MAG: TonB-dependent receptor plug domain-containing protein [Lentisphaeraceae bacterium]|nr:TonB-dependent receptor plug domain-containing protein [Lentisphaeraceae bacterium]
MRCFLTCLFLLSPMLADEYTFSFEELANMTISSVTAQETELKNTPAAVYVITAVDIKKGGFQSIPEALRMVPGLQVSRINANIWSIGSRGFSGRFNEKMLVMIDGRSVYSTFFAGVFWELQDVVLEDIERIEVIRGPGATLWGANAVNGVINVITKKAEDTLGSYLKVVGGTEHQGLGTLRYGDNFNDEVVYR